MQIRIGTRRSKLALVQTNLVASQLQLSNKDLDIEIVPIQTTGDKLSSTPLALIGGKGLFLKEIEEQLLAGNIDIAVHSMKDVPIFLPEGLAITTVLPREDPRDVFISMQYPSINLLPTGATIGTCSSRRKILLQRMCDNIQVVDLRGNVDTRLKKLHSGEVDAIILAAAGLKRLELMLENAVYLSEMKSWQEREAKCSSSYMNDEQQTQSSFIRGIYLEYDDFIPAVAQGAIGVEYVQENNAIAGLLAPLIDQMTAACVGAERAFLQAVGGDCKTPLGAYANIVDHTLTLRAFLASPTSTIEQKFWLEKHSVPVEKGEILGEQMGAAAKQHCMSSQG